MNSKYFEYIVVYSAVIVGCLLLGILARMFVINMGADEFTAGIVFWIVVLLGILAYAILTLLIDGLYSATVRWFFPRKKSKLLDHWQFNNSCSLKRSMGILGLMMMLRCRLHRRRTIGR